MNVVRRNLDQLLGVVVGLCLFDSFGWRGSLYFVAVMAVLIALLAAYEFGKRSRG